MPHGGRGDSIERSRSNVTSRPYSKRDRHDSGAGRGGIRRAARPPATPPGSVHEAAAAAAAPPSSHRWKLDTHPGGHPAEVLRVNGWGDGARPHPFPTDTNLDTHTPYPHPVPWQGGCSGASAGDAPRAEGAPSRIPIVHRAKGGGERAAPNRLQPADLETPPPNVRARVTERTCGSPLGAVLPPAIAMGSSWTAWPGAATPSTRGRRPRCSSRAVCYRVRTAAPARSRTGPSLDLHRFDPEPEPLETGNPSWPIQRSMPSTSSSLRSRPTPCSRGGGPRCRDRPAADFDADSSYFWDLETNAARSPLRLMPEVAPMHVASTIYPHPPRLLRRLDLPPRDHAVHGAGRVPPRLRHRWPGVRVRGRVRCERAARQAGPTQHGERRPGHRRQPVLPHLRAHPVTWTASTPSSARSSTGWRRYAPSRHARPTAGRLPSRWRSRRRRFGSSSHAADATRRAPPPPPHLCYQKRSSARMSRGETFVLVMQPAQDRPTHDLALAPGRDRGRRSSGAHSSSAWCGRTWL